MERPSKRLRLLSDESASDSDGLEDTSPNIKINEEYAQRFHHNKDREERQRLEEKYGEATPSDSESESEDDEGLLVTQELDAEIVATLQAIRSKDPRVYDKQSTFYKPDDLTAPVEGGKETTKEKPVFLRDYHRKNLLNGGTNGEAETTVPATYADEQFAVKRSLLDQMHEDSDEEDGEDSEGDDFLVKKPGQTIQPAPLDTRPKVDVDQADKDPEIFLSNFMAARAWVPTSTSQFQAFESEDEDEVDRAESFEAAFNLRFEDPTHANEKLLSHSREAAAKYSVRREEVKGRKRMRDAEKARRDAQKLEREEEKSRFRRLKIEEAQEKLQKFKEAAGLQKQAVAVEEWSTFLEAGWDSEKWDQEMAKRFGDSYYAVGDEDHEEEEPPTAVAKGKKKSKVKKPKWEDDIDIGDILPDFDEEEERNRQTIRLSDEEDEEEAASDGGVTLASAPVVAEGELDPIVSQRLNKPHKKDAERLRMDQKRQARRDRQRIEELVDQSLVTDLPVSGASSGETGRFRYRDTSPSTFGLSARDILMADDSQLNQFAGLKKLASFRDQERKKKDKKKLGKKARLRQWRKETFGDEEGPRTPFEDYVNARRDASAMLPRMLDAAAEGPREMGFEGKKKKRSRKRKLPSSSN